MRTLAFVLAAALLLVSGCSLTGNGGGSSGGAEREEAPAAPTSQSNPKIDVIDSALGTQVDEERKIVGGTTNVFPLDTKQVYAVVVLGGPSAGDLVTGRWYKLDGPSAQPAGTLISEAGIELDERRIGSNKVARVALNLTASGDGLAEGQWLVRIYLNDALIRTMAFIVTPRTLGPIPTSTAGPAPSGASATPAASTPASPQAGTSTPGPLQTATITPSTPTAEATLPTSLTHTVEPGDTLSLIAERFKTPGESTESYLARLIQLNGLASSDFLFVGEVLKLPGSP